MREIEFNERAFLATGESLGRVRSQIEGCGGTQAAMGRMVQLAEFRFQQMADAPMPRPAGCGVGGGHDPEEVRRSWS